MKKICFENIKEHSLLRFFKSGDRDFDFMKILINIKIYFNDQKKPMYNDDISNIIMFQNKPQTNVFDLVIPNHTNKVDIILSTASPNFDLNTIACKLS